MIVPGDSPEALVEAYTTHCALLCDVLLLERGELEAPGERDARDARDARGKTVADILTGECVAHIHRVGYAHTRAETDERCFSRIQQWIHSERYAALLAALFGAITCATSRGSQPATLESALLSVMFLVRPTEPALARLGDALRDGPRRAAGAGGCA